MAYAVKYRITQATQSGVNEVLDMLEDGYAGSVITYNATFLNLQYIPESDDPFEPIYASQLAVGINVTDNVANMPDFTAMDDRKYHCKLYRGASLRWQGWALSDNVQFLFSTGFKEVTFNAICGLGMLNSIDYETSQTDYRARLLEFLQRSLKPIDFPEETFITSSCSIYSSTMFNRTDNPNSEPWFQAYMAVNNFVNVQTDEAGVSRNTFTCLQVLRDILFSWGCRIMMANGEWFIFQLNQAAESTRYWTRYSLDTGYDSDGTFTTNLNVPTDGLFIGNSQLKIYKKGFNNFVSFKQIEFARNLLYNANLKLFSGNDATLWAETVSGTGLVAIRENQDKGINAFIMTLGDVTTGALAQIESETPIPIAFGDAPTLQFRIYNTTFNLDGGGALLPNCLIRLVLSTALGTYVLNEDNEWDDFTIGYDNYYQVNDKGNNTLVNLEEIPPVPNTGTLSFGVIVKGSGVNTQSAIIIGDFEVSITSEFKSVQITAEINATDSYRKEVVFPHGYNIDNPDSGVTPSHLGAITDVDGNQMSGWYMFERVGVDNYFSLAELMFQNYVNMLRQNIINIDATIEGNINPNEPLTFTDTDPSQISVTGSKYVLGLTTFNPVKNEIQGTYLQVDNTHQETTTTVVYDNGIGKGIEQAVSNSAGLSSAAACAFTTYEQTKYTVQFLPVVGDFVYNDINLTQPFAGSGLWWKFSIVYFNTTRSYRINASGEILESSTC
jgi:hypothetical protein